MQDLELGWVAGYLEGEGSFLLRTGCSRPVVRVSCTDLDTLERLQGAVGGRIYPVTKRQPHWKDAWVWQLSGAEEAASLMKVIKPLMGNRRQNQITHCIEAYERHGQQMERYHQGVAARRERVRLLHQQGGLTHQAIADQVGLERSTVSHILGGRWG